MRTHDSAGAELAADCVESLQEAVRLYRGDLVEGWYHDWCLYERERLQNMYLAMLDKLICYYEAHRKFELGLLYGSIILRYDRAHERTHRQLMNLQYLSGNRTAALRQFERCVAALDEELGVKPDKLTTALYQKIRAAELEAGASPAAAAPEAEEAGVVSLSDVLGRLKLIQSVLTEIQRSVQRDIKAVELTINNSVN
jgi:DNA-binding SARP family transcriptional activator